MDLFLFSNLRIRAEVQPNVHTLIGIEPADESDRWVRTRLTLKRERLYCPVIVHLIRVAIALQVLFTSCRAADERRIIMEFMQVERRLCYVNLRQKLHYLKLPRKQRRFDTERYCQILKGKLYFAILLQLLFLYQNKKGLKNFRSFWKVTFHSYTIANLQLARLPRIITSFLKHVSLDHFRSRTCFHRVDRSIKIRNLHENYIVVGKLTASDRLYARSSYAQ